MINQRNEDSIKRKLFIDLYTQPGVAGVKEWI